MSPSAPLEEPWLVGLGCPLNIPCLRDIAVHTASSAMIAGPIPWQEQWQIISEVPLKQGCDVWGAIKGNKCPAAICCGDWHICCSWVCACLGRGTVSVRCRRLFVPGLLDLSNSGAGICPAMASSVYLIGACGHLIIKPKMKCIRR